MAVRERVGLLELTCFAKYEIHGSDAETFLKRICANRIPKRKGGVALVHMLTELGGIECEATITRIEEINIMRSQEQLPKHMIMTGWFNIFYPMKMCPLGT